MAETLAINPMPDDVNDDWRDLPIIDFIYGKDERPLSFNGRFIYTRTVNGIPCYGIMLIGDTSTVTNLPIDLIDLPAEIVSGLIQL